MQLFYFSLVQELDGESHNAVLKTTAIASTKFKPSRRYAIVVHFKNASTLRALVSSSACAPKRAGHDPVKTLKANAPVVACGGTRTVIEGSFDRQTLSYL